MIKDEVKVNGNKKVVLYKNTPFKVVLEPNLCGASISSSSLEWCSTSSKVQDAFITYEANGNGPKFSAQALHEEAIRLVINSEKKNKFAHTNSRLHNIKTNYFHGKGIESIKCISSEVKSVLSNIVKDLPSAYKELDYALDIDFIVQESEINLPELVPHQDGTVLEVQHTWLPELLYSDMPTILFFMILKNNYEGGNLGIYSLPFGDLSYSRSLHSLSEDTQKAKREVNLPRKAGSGYTIIQNMYTGEGNQPLSKRHVILHGHDAYKAPTGEKPMMTCLRIWMTVKDRGSLVNKLPKFPYPAKEKVIEIKAKEEQETKFESSNPTQSAKGTYATYALYLLVILLAALGAYFMKPKSQGA